MKVFILKDMSKEAPYKEGSLAWHTWIDITTIGHDVGTVVLLSTLDSILGCTENEYPLDGLNQLIKDGWIEVKE